MNLVSLKRILAADPHGPKPTGRFPGIRRKFSGADKTAGFTLLEVLVSLAVLSVGAALTLSLISGSLGNIRKVQLRTRTIEHAEAVMELALLDESIQYSTTFTGDFQDGTRWTVRVEEYTLPDAPPQIPTPRQSSLRVQLFSYTVNVMSPDSVEPDYRLETLKLVKAPSAAQPMGLPR